jgi:hypothetical protein
VLNLAVSDLLIVATNLPILIYNSVSGSVRIRGENYVGIGFLGKERFMSLFIKYSANLMSVVPCV